MADVKNDEYEFSVDSCGGMQFNTTKGNYGSHVRVFFACDAFAFDRGEEMKKKGSILSPSSFFLNHLSF